jgi:hypothetical protein
MVRLMNELAARDRERTGSDDGNDGAP